MRISDELLRRVLERAIRPGQRPVKTGEIVTDAFNDLRWEVEVLEQRIQRIGMDRVSDERFDSQLQIVGESLDVIRATVANARQLFGPADEVAP